MTRIIRESEVCFYELLVGDVFECGEELYIKIEPLTGDDGVANAIDMQRGYAAEFGEECAVRRANITITVG